MRRIFLTVVRFSVVPVLLVLGAVTGGLDGFVGWFFLAWMLFRAAPSMWQDVKNVGRWFFGFRRRVVSSVFSRRAVGDLNV